MKTHNETIRNSVTQNPFTTPPVSGRRLAVCGLFATAYAALFSVAIANNTVSTPQAPVTVAAAEGPAHWGLKIRGLSKAELASLSARSDVGHAIARQGNAALRQILAESRPLVPAGLPKMVVEPFDVASR